MRKEDCNTVHFSTYDCLVQTNFNPQKLYSFQSLSLGFILKILAKFHSLHILLTQILIKQTVYTKGSMQLITENKDPGFSTDEGKLW